MPRHHRKKETRLSQFQVDVHINVFIGNFDGAGGIGSGGAIRLVSSGADILSAYFQFCTFDGNGSSQNGAAISMDAVNVSLGVDHCLFQYNSASDNGSAIHMEDSSVGTANVTLTVTSSYFQFNGASSAALHATYATTGSFVVAVERSSFFDNDAVEAAGAVVLASANPGSFSFSNSTFAYNEVFGGEAYAGALQLLNGNSIFSSCSIYSNAGSGSNSDSIGVVGGVDASGGFLLATNSMFADNTGAAGVSNNADEIRMRAGAFLDGGHNFVRGSVDGLALTAPGNIIGQDPQVDPLTSGPSVGVASNSAQMLILDPQTGSPLINAGDSSEAEDQIGNIRPIANVSDIGAIESYNVALIQVSGDGSIITNGSTDPNSADGSYFGLAPVVGGAVLHSFLIEGLGPASLSLTGAPLVAISGPHAGDFVVTAFPSTTTLYSRESTGFDITFTPSASGVRNATVSIANTAPSADPFTFDLRGDGVGAILVTEPGSNTAVTEGGATDTLQIAFDSLPNANIDVTIQPDNQLDLGNGPGFPITVNFTATDATTPQIITVTATDDSDSEGPHSGNLSFTTESADFAFDQLYQTDITVAITDNDSEIAISGNGQEIFDGSVGISLADWTDFGATRTGAGVTGRSYTITNLSDTDLTFGTVTLTGAGSADYSVTQQPTGPVANAATTTLTIDFTASVDGDRSAIVSIPNNDPDESPFTFSVSGFGAGNDMAFVNSNVVGGNADGSSWVNAFPFLQDGLAAGLPSIWVAGSHTPDRDNPNPGGTGDPTTFFDIPANTSILGGFGGWEIRVTHRVPSQYPTIISADLAGDDDPTDLASITRAENSHNLLVANGAATMVDGVWIVDSGAFSAVHCAVTGQLTISNSVFLRNQLAILNEGTLALSNSRIMNNLTGVDNSGTMTIVNCDFSGNGDAVTNFSTLTVANSSFYRSSGFAIQGVSDMTLANSVFFDNNGVNPDVTVTGGSIASYNCLSVALTGTGNIIADPLFVDADGADNIPGTLDDDLRLAAGSPAIDAGDDAAAIALGLTTDLDGNARIVDDAGIVNTGTGSIDMGAHEFSGTSDVGIVVVGNAADIAKGDATPSRLDHTDFLSADVTTGAPVRSFSIENRGNASLNIGTVTISGANSGDFSITTPPASSIAGTSSSNFSIQFDPSATGLRSATVTIPNADVAGNPYVFDIAGWGSTGVTFVSSAATGAGDGSSWVDAFPFLQDGIATGSTNIWAAGTHSPDEDAGNPAGTGNPAATYTLLSSGRILGGFGGWERSAAQSNPSQWPTILNGDRASIDNIVSAGFDSYTLQNLTISGGADSALVSDSTDLQLIGVTMSDNDGLSGGAIRNLGQLTAISCRFLANESLAGGAIHSVGGLTIRNCVFLSNVAVANGGAIFSQSAIDALNTSFGSNSAGGLGGAVHVQAGTADLANCIFADNTSDHISGPAFVSYSCFNNLAIAGPGNITADPLFVNLAAGDVSLRSTSPCLDAGDNLPVIATNLATDILGNFRLQDLSSAPNTGNGGSPIVDMGAYEFAGNVPYDFGDAPDPSYNTSLFSDGPRHILTGPYLGAAVDGEIDGQASVGSDGDDADGQDDEDGITVLTTAVPNQSVDIQVTVGHSQGRLSIWVDGDHDGDFAGNQVLADRLLAIGTHVVSVALPDSFTPGVTVARYRLSTATGLSYTGGAPNGEVEDHPFTIANSAPIAVDDTANTAQDSVVAGNVLANDNDPNNDPLAVSAVNGAGGNVGNLLTLGSGAQVTVDADGGFTYSPNGVFNGLTVGQTATDTFAYTASDSVDTDSAVVVVTITGVSMDPNAIIPGVLNGVLDDFVVFRQGLEVIVTRDGVEVLRQADGSLTSITFNGSDDDSLLTVDYSGGDPLTGISTVFNGGFGNDTLTLDDSFINQGIHHVAGDPTGFSGFCMLDGARIDFSGLSPINLGASVDTAIFLPDVNNNDAVLEAGVTPGHFQLTGSSFEDCFGPNPSGTLIIEFGDADNALSINGLNAFSGDLVVVDGAGTDSVSVDATLRTNGGSIDLGADTITIVRTIETTGGHVIFNANDGVTLVGSTGDINTAGGDYIVDADADTDGTGTYLQSSLNSSVQAGGGNVAIIAANFALGGSIISNVVDLVPSMSQSIDLGFAGFGDIVISDGDAKRISTPSLNIGSAIAGNISINGSFFPTASALALLTAGSVEDDDVNIGISVSELFIGADLGVGLTSPFDVSALEVTVVTNGEIHIRSHSPALLDLRGLGPITIIGDILDILGLAGIDALEISTLTPGASIGLGGATGDLELDDADLANIAPGFTRIAIGDVDSAAITLETAAFLSPLFLAADRIVDSAGLNDVSAPAVFFDGIVSPVDVFDIDGHAEFLPGSIFEVDMAAPGTNPGVDHDQIGADSLTVTGTILDASWTGAAPAEGQPVIIALGNPTTGTFVGLPDGAGYIAGNEGFHVDYGPSTGIALIANILPNPVDDPLVVAVGDTVSDNLLGNDVDPDTAGFGDTITATALDGSNANIATPYTLASNAIVTLNTDGSFTYDTNGQFAALDAGDTATDAVSYTIADNLGGTGVATVRVVIHGQSDPPVAGDDAITANEDFAVLGGGLLGNDFDPEGSPFAVSSFDAVSTSGANVTVNAAGAYTYDPRVSATLQTIALGASVTDTFTYTISDVTGSDTATVVIAVHGANDAPSAAPDVDATLEDSVLISGGIIGNDSDIDLGDTRNARAETVASLFGGNASIAADGSFTYNGIASFQHLATGAQETDSFSYTLVDNNGATDQASVVITITGENDAPIAVADSATVAEDNILNGSSILGNDNDVDIGDTHIADAGVNSSALGASVTIAATGDFTYDGGTAAFAQPLAIGDTLTDSFTYIIRDGNNATDQGTVVVIIHGSNDGVVAVADSDSVTENGFLNGSNVLTNDLDDDNGATLTVSRADTTSALGVPISVAAGGTYVYDITGVTTFDYLATGGVGTDQFTYIVSDGASTSVGTVIITVTGINDPLDARPDTYTVREDESLSATSVLANDLEADVADVLRVDSSDTTSIAGAHVAVKPDGTFLYDSRFVPGVSALNSGESMVDTFTYIATDGHGSFSGATVTITIRGENDAPLANIGGPYNGQEGTPLTVSAAGSTDPNNNLTNYFWDLDGDGQYDDASGITASFTNLNDGVHNIGLLVRDATGFTDTDSTTVTLTNVAPIAVAGGPYVGGASTAIPISALNSIDPGNDIVSYAWDLDDDGAFDDANTADTSFTSAFGGTFPIRLRVVDANGESSSDTTTVITNLSITWENLVNVVTFGSQGENLRKTTGGSWNASASSVQNLDEDGYLSVQHNISNGKRMIGLSRTEHGTHFRTIEYALYLNYGNLEIYENGVPSGSFGPSLGKELRIEIQDGDIIYWRGTAELRRVTGVVTEPFSFVADVSMDTLAGTIEGAELVVPPPQSPQIIGYSATDPDNQNDFYSRDDQVRIKFHQKTNMGGYALNQPLSQVQLDDLITFVPAPGSAYTGYWSAKDTLIVDIQATSSLEPLVGTAYCVTAGGTPIEHEKAPLLALVTQSPALSGNWGSVLVKWIEGVNVRIDDNYLKRSTTVPNNWNGGAVSSRKISGDVYFETIVTSRGKHRMIGLGNSNDSAHFSDINYAFFLHRAGGLEGYESGTQVGGMGSYQTGDVLRIEIIGSTLTYQKNSVVLRTVTIDPDTLFPVQVDTSFNDNGGDFDNTILVTPDPPPTSHCQLRRQRPG